MWTTNGIFARSWYYFTGKSIKTFKRGKVWGSMKNEIYGTLQRQEIQKGILRAWSSNGRNCQKVNLIELVAKHWQNLN